MSAKHRRCHGPLVDGSGEASKLCNAWRMTKLYPACARFNINPAEYALAPVKKRPGLLFCRPCAMQVREINECNKHRHELSDRHLQNVEASLGVALGTLDRPWVYVCPVCDKIIARDDSLTRHVKNIHGLDERAANCRRDASEVPPCPRILRGDARVRAGLPCKRARKTTPARLEDEDYDVPSSSSCPSTPSSSSSRLSTPRSRSLCSSPPTSDCSSLSSTPSLSDYELSAPATSPPSTPAPTTPALSPNCDDLELQYPDDFLPAYAGPLLPELDPAMLPPMEPEPLPQYERASWLADGLFDTYDNDLLGYGFERPAEYQPLDTYAPPEPDFIFDFEMELPTSYTGLDLSWPSSSGLDVSF